MVRIIGEDFNGKNAHPKHAHSLPIFEPISPSSIAEVEGTIKRNQEKQQDLMTLQLSSRK